MVLATAWIKAAVSPEKLYHHHGLSAPLSRDKTPPSITARRTGRTGALSDQQASPIRSVAAGAETFRLVPQPPAASIISCEGRCGRFDGYLSSPFSGNEKAVLIRERLLTYASAKTIRFILHFCIFLADNMVYCKYSYPARR